MAAVHGNTIDPSRLSSWIEIRPDNTIAVRTGVGDFGQGSVSTGFRQIVAEELRVPFEAVTELIAGDSDRTPDGGISAAVLNKDSQAHLLGGLGIHPDSPFGRNALNLQKVAAYAYQALLERAGLVLEAPAESLTASHGVMSSGARKVSYAELVRDSPLDLTIPVSGSLDGAGLVVLGTPPVVPVSEYRVIGVSCPNPRVPPIVKGTLGWVGSVRLRGMLHGRVVHPPTLGSTLISVGPLDKGAYPTAQSVVVANFVGVVSPDEWEATRAAHALAQSATWTDWHALPESDGLVEAMLDLEWSKALSVATSPDEASVAASLQGAPRKLEAAYSLPFFKHAPIGPETTVGDVRSDGTVHVWTCSQKVQALRMRIAAMLETEIDNVVVHFADGAASFGRTTQGDGGSEAEAVLLSRAAGRPVRLQWSRDDDFAWSTQQAPYLGNVSVGLDVEGRMIAFLAEHRQPGINDGRLLGALLAGLPTGPLSPPDGLVLNQPWVEWPYDLVPDRVEIAYGAPNLGQAESPIHIGLRHRSMRSPQHLQQNFAVECMVSEAAAAARADPIEYRLDHTTDLRLSGVLEAVRAMSAWESRPSPAPLARADGAGVVRGRGIGVAIRHGGYFASVAEISVELETGKITVDRYWVAADLGVVVNPRLLRLNIEGGSAMGISQALIEELKFNRSTITSTDFQTYPILTMAEMPEIEVKIIERPEVMSVGQGAEPPNMLPPVAIAGAFFDATGKHIRRLPMRPEYVRAELRGG